MDKKYVYSFYEGEDGMVSLLGLKGSNLAEMSRSGLPVPYGFTLTTEVCRDYLKTGVLSDPVVDQIREKLAELEEVAELRFGDPERPLLVSVRAGAPAATPGVFSAVLNVGLDRITARALENQTRDPRFVFDSYANLIRMYAVCVDGVSQEPFREALEKRRREDGSRPNMLLSTECLRYAKEDYLRIFREQTGRPFPQDPWRQLMEVITAQFRTWETPRAKAYRRAHDIPDDAYPAVTIQQMAFGNLSESSGSGIAWTRDPETGEKTMRGKFWQQIQKGDLSPHREINMVDIESLFPGKASRFRSMCDILERHYQDMQGVEFVMEHGRLYLLDAKPAVRTPQAAVRVTAALVDEGLIDRKTAVLRIDPAMVDQILLNRLRPEDFGQAIRIGEGIPSAPGAASGRVAFTDGQAEHYMKNGDPVIFVHKTLTAKDIPDIVKTSGTVSVSHASTYVADTARSVGSCCITGCPDAEIDEVEGFLAFGDQVIRAGDWISLDGSDGGVYAGRIRVTPADLNGDLGRILTWADEFRTMRVRSNADTPEEAAQALKFGTEGIGLCRTEHMFFSEERLHLMRALLLSRSKEQSRRTLARLLPYHKSDFAQIFRLMGTRPVNIRLMDPSLSGFMPKTEEDIRAAAKEMGMTTQQLLEEIKPYQNQESLLGERGCRLSIRHPEFIAMQTEAIFRAAIEVSDELGKDIVPEIMIPMVSDANEMKIVKKMVTDTAERVMRQMGKELDYQIGAMIEVPRAALTADRIAENAEFFSFGTNDLTMMTYGFSRMASSDVIESYIDEGVLDSDPFTRLDTEGVGSLMKMAVTAGRRVRPNMKFGICGIQAGDPRSVEFCHRIGLHYVSCSPNRVPVARIVAAQAALKGAND